MGLADLIFGKTNPFSQFVDANGNKLAGIGAGLASGPDFSSGLARAAQNSFAARPADNAYAVQQQAEQERLANISKTAQWLQKNYPQFSNLPVDQGFQLAAQLQAKQAQMQANPVDPASTAGGRAQLADQYGLTGNDKATFVLTGKMPGGNQTARAGVGQPYAVQNKKDRSIIYMQPMTIGPSVNALTGEPLPNPEDYQPAPYDIAAQKAGGTVDAQTAANARAALPGAQTALNITKRATELLLGDQTGMDQQFGNTLFIPNRNIPTIPGVAFKEKGNWMANFKQLGGQAFMQARAMLKGGGQITDFEGMKAEDAFSRMQASVDNGDENNFKIALADFNNAVEMGYQKLLAVTRGDYAAGNVPSLDSAPNPGGGGDLSTLSNDELLRQLAQ